MKLTRKRAIEEAWDRAYEMESLMIAASVGVDLGIVLGLQMAAKECAVYGRHNAAIVINEKITRRLKKLEKGK
jgi:cytochrome bd-type quinol oxidase subunit 2